MNNSYIAERSKGKMKGDILKIGAMAKADKASGNHVIDATIGVFLNDDKSINTVPAVIEDLNNNVTKNVGYAPITGYPKFKEGLLKWYLKDEYEERVKEFKTVTKEEVINVAKRIKLNTIYLLKGEDK